MFNALFARLSALLSVYFMGPVLSGVSARTRRGAGFMEYALLAAIAVGVYVVIQIAFPDAITRVFNRVMQLLGQTK